MTDQMFFNLYGYQRNPPPPVPFVRTVQPYNSQSMASYNQARELRDAINGNLYAFPQGKRVMGGGILEGDDSAKGPGDDISGLGIFRLRADYMETPTAQAPNGEGYYTLMIHFQNGCVMNVGLICDAFGRNAYNQLSVLLHLINEVEENGRS